MENQRFWKSRRKESYLVQKIKFFTYRMTVKYYAIIEIRKKQKKLPVLNCIMSSRIFV
jgi:hypothetical protein